MRVQNLLQVALFEQILLEALALAQRLLSVRTPRAGQHLQEAEKALEVLIYHVGNRVLEELGLLHVEQPVDPLQERSQTKPNAADEVVQTLKQEGNHKHPAPLLADRHLHVSFVFNAVHIVVLVRLDRGPNIVDDAHLRFFRVLEGFVHNQPHIAGNTPDFWVGLHGHKLLHQRIVLRHCAHIHQRALLGRQQPAEALEEPKMRRKFPPVQVLEAEKGIHLRNGGVLIESDHDLVQQRGALGQTGGQPGVFAQLARTLLGLLLVVYLALDQLPALLQRVRFALDAFGHVDFVDEFDHLWEHLHDSVLQHHDCDLVFAHPDLLEIKQVALDAPQRCLHELPRLRLHCNANQHLNRWRRSLPRKQGSKNAGPTHLGGLGGDARIGHFLVFVFRNQVKKQAVVCGHCALFGVGLVFVDFDPVYYSVAVFIGGGDADHVHFAVVNSYARPRADVLALVEARVEANVDRTLQSVDCLRIALLVALPDAGCYELVAWLHARMFL